MSTFFFFKLILYGQRYSLWLKIIKTDWKCNFQRGSYVLQWTWRLKGDCREFVLGIISNKQGEGRDIQDRKTALIPNFEYHTSRNFAGTLLLKILHTWEQSTSNQTFEKKIKIKSSFLIVLEPMGTGSPDIAHYRLNRPVGKMK